MKKEEMLKLRLEGQTYQYIADKAGISRQRVQQLLSPPVAIRRIVVARGKGTCQVCGIRVGYSGHVHHKGGKEEDYNDLENLQLLCPSCHRNQHFQNEHRIETIIGLKCPRCGSEHWGKAGFSPGKDNDRQRYRCLECGTTIS